MTEVIISGGGPTGLMLAGELALAGVEVTILERRGTEELVGTRARGFHARTLEILDQRGIAERFLAEGRTVAALSFAGTALDLSALPTRHPYTLGISQGQVEAILLGWVEQLGVPIRRGIEVAGFAQDEDGVDVRIADGEAIRSAYLVGADGGRSVIRRTAGIEFVGAEATRSHLIAEAQVSETVPTGVQLDDVGIHAMNVAEDGKTVGLVVTEQEVGPSTEPTLAELRTALTSTYGTDFGIHDPTWISRFTDATRQAAAYRSGRVLIAGDAAHIHPPTGGQGIGLGVQDAVNLGWKLAQVVHGLSPDDLLDTYHAERYPATARVLENVMTQALLQRGDVRTQAVSHTFADLLTCAGPRARLIGLLTGLDVTYGAGEVHPLLGRRMPDLDLITIDGPRRVFELLHDARPLLLNLGTPDDTDIAPWADRVTRCDAEHHGAWELPDIGAVSAPTGVLIRPDGHVAWVGEGSTAGLEKALTIWFGTPATEKSA